MSPLARPLLALLIASAAPAALAQPASPVTGAWRFETAPYDDGVCRMSGTMTIVRTSTANAFTCTFTATEHCGDREWSAEQTCTARRSGHRLEITSTIVRLSPPNLSYAPDNWSLTIRSSDLMVGELRSADIANVEFRRGPALTS